VDVLAEHFIKVSAILNSRNVTKLSQGALEKLRSWTWPGNVRELENVVERAVLIATSEEVVSETSSLKIRISKTLCRVSVPMKKVSL